MRSPIATLGVATALALCCLQPGARAEDQPVELVCIQVIIAGIVNAGLGETCVPTPFVTGVTHREYGLQPYIWIIIDVRHP